MKPVISAKDIEELVAKGGDVQSLPTDALLTPSAKDLLRDLARRGHRAEGGSTDASSRSTVPAPPANPLSARS